LELFSVLLCGCLLLLIKYNIIERTSNENPNIHYAFRHVFWFSFIFGSKNPTLNNSCRKHSCIFGVDVLYLALEELKMIVDCLTDSSTTRGGFPAQFKNWNPMSGLIVIRTPDNLCFFREPFSPEHILLCNFEEAKDTIEILEVFFSPWKFNWEKDFLIVDKEKFYAS
jgi:hypothetical protein